MIDGSESEIHKIYYAKCTYNNIDNTLRTCYTQANGRKGLPAGRTGILTVAVGGRRRTSPLTKGRTV